MNRLPVSLLSGLALSLALAACNSPAVPPTLDAGKQPQVVTAARPETKTPAKLHHVQFRLNLPTGFKTQHLAEASYAKLEIHNKYNLAAHGLPPNIPLYATNADANGFVQVSGDKILLGADIPTGNNWLVKVKLYSNPSEAALIQELSAGFSMPGDDVVDINARTHLVGTLLAQFQAINYKYPVGHPKAGLGYLDDPIDFDALQEFADGFAGIPDNFENPEPEFPATEPTTEPTLKTYISTDPISYPRIEALTPAAQTIDGVPQVRPPSVSLAEIDIHALALDIIAGNVIQTYAGGQAAAPANYRRPGYLNQYLKLGYRDPQSGAMAFNPTSKRLFLVNHDVGFNDPYETLEAVQLDASLNMTALWTRNNADTTLGRVDSRVPSLGQSGNGTGTSNLKRTVFLMTRVPNGLPNEVGAVSLTGLNQDTGATLWTHTFENGPNGANPTHFNPIVLRNIGCLHCNGDDVADTVFTVVHGPIPANQANPTSRGVYKMTATNPPTQAAKFDYFNRASFTSGGALSFDTTKLYLLSSNNSSVGSPTFEPPKLWILNTSDMSKQSEISLPDDEKIDPLSTPSLGADGTVYFTAYKTTSTTSHGVIYAYNPNGTQKWRFALPTLDHNQDGIARFGPVILSNQSFPILYVLNRRGDIYALEDKSTSASIKWNDYLDTTLHESPTLIENSDHSISLYLGSVSNKGKIYAVDPLTGALQWSLFPGGFFASGMVVRDGYAFVSTRSGNYGDFTGVRSVKVDALGIAPSSISPWPKYAGTLANSSNRRNEDNH